MRSASRRLSLAFLLLLNAGCALPYYLHAASGQMSLMRQRVPIGEILADPEADPRTREWLELVLRLRRFAFDELGLPESESYTSYVDLDRDFVVWNVVAAGQFSVEPVTWCFPVAGCVAYRGYFAEERAEAFAERLRERGYDTFVGGSPAYSTLGHFRDPVLSTMLGRGEIAIAALLFHEMAHQRIYVKDDTELSESFATAVEQYAVERWLAAGDRLEALADYRQSLARRQQFADLVANQRRRLSEIYAGETDPEQRLPAKEAAFTAMRRDYEALKAGWGGARDYDGWFDGSFNNARLVALTSYQRWVPGLKARLEQLGPAGFYAELDELIALEPAARELRLEALDPR